MGARRDEATCWTMVRAAARGDDAARGAFAGAYVEVVRAFLVARWRGGPLAHRVEDAVQDVFLECFRPDGPLVRLDADHPGRFRAFLFGVVRNVARRHEERRQRDAGAEGPSRIEALAADAESVATAFDRAWARCLLRRAAERHRAWARDDGAALRRVEILRLRFAEGLPVREIAERLDIDPDAAHAEYRKAREEFKKALREEVLFHEPDAPSPDAACEKLLEIFR